LNDIAFLGGKKVFVESLIVADTRCAKKDPNSGIVTHSYL